MTKRSAILDSSIWKSRIRDGLGRPLMASLLAVAMASCASTPEPPTEALQAAQLAIESAEQARVADYAASELGAAREALAEARVAVQDEEMVRARRLAERSRASAELATARASEARNREINGELQKTIDALEQELQRNSGDRP